MLCVLLRLHSPLHPTGCDLSTGLPGWGAECELAGECRCSRVLCLGTGGHRGAPDV